MYRHAAAAGIVLALLALPTPATADRGIGTATRASRVWVLGDGTTNAATDTLRTIKPGWIIDGMAGRRVQSLPYLIRSHMRRDGAPRVAVLALGTNTSEGWSRRDFRDAIALLPRESRVVFVTPYRDPQMWPGTSKITARYARWMRGIARWSPDRVSVADWAKVATLPGMLDGDGVHQTPAGAVVWAGLVREQVKGWGW